MGICWDNPPSSAVFQMENKAQKTSPGIKAHSQTVDAQGPVLRLSVSPGRAAKGKGEAQGALALGHVTAPRPGLVGCPWRWGSITLGQACRECECVHEDSPSVSLRLKRLSRNTRREKSAVRTCSCPLAVSFAMACFLLLQGIYLGGEKRRCFLQSQMEPIHLGFLFTTYDSSCSQR